MKHVKIMRGLPGSGKSTWIDETILRLTGNWEVCSADHYFMINGEYKFDPREISNAHKSCYKKFVSAVTEGIDTIFVDNTNTQLWEMTPYIQFAELMDYEVEIIEFQILPEVCGPRNTHGVPAVQIKKMFDNWQDCLPWWKRTIITGDRI